MNTTKKHFTQASCTPFATEPLLSIVGRNTEHGLACLDRAINAEGISKATRALLTKMHSDQLPPISTQFEANDLHSGFSAWREGTTTSPDGPHLGHYRAIMAPEETFEDFEQRRQNLESIRGIADPSRIPDMSEEESHHGTELKGDDILQAIATILTLIFKHGLIIANWLTIFNVIIEKTPGNPRIDKLRVIHIMDGTWNLATGILGSKRLQAQCEDFGILNDGQWGLGKDEYAPK